MCKRASFFEHVTTCKMTLIKKRRHTCPLSMYSLTRLKSPVTATALQSQHDGLGRSSVMGQPMCLHSMLPTTCAESPCFSNIHLSVDMKNLPESARICRRMRQHTETSEAHIGCSLGKRYPCQKYSSKPSTTTWSDAVWALLHVFFDSRASPHTRRSRWHAILQGRLVTN